MSRVSAFLACVACLALAAHADRFEAGKGVANERATGAGPNDVTFVSRGVDGPYGYGVVNAARRLRGMQIGLANFNEAGIFFPILNFGF